MMLFEASSSIWTAWLYFLSVYSLISKNSNLYKHAIMFFYWNICMQMVLTLYFEKHFKKFFFNEKELALYEKDRPTLLGKVMVN